MLQLSMAANIYKYISQLADFNLASLLVCMCVRVSDYFSIITASVIDFLQVECLNLTITSMVPPVALSSSGIDRCVGHFNGHAGSRAGYHARIGGLSASIGTRHLCRASFVPVEGKVQQRPALLFLFPFLFCQPVVQANL
ncbi:hypothetical protein D917_06481 [Trichinella nativa]|uniref:Uncharacterized protein n=1 Tax=Trichinella nativa TaxID=6335 RepID=A0A1Y3ES95_9BILA|nr:hypothetical protein D917_06481 [Trichinella nativa]